MIPAGLVLALGLALPPPPTAPIPASPRPLAAALVQTERSLNEAIDRWATSAAPPRDVTLLALYVQRIIRALAANVRLAAAVVRLDPAAADDVAARTDLAALASSSPSLRVPPRVGPAPRADRLLRWYREAQTRFGVRWQLLAAVNFVESGFGRIRNASTAGAQGPMQFEPATWRAYGLGGDVHDPHDAILGAANYLAANHAASDERAALFHYNHSPLYVDAVARYTRRITHDRRGFLRYYSWQVYVRTRAGYRRVTGPR
ncbi:MAG: lytic transglycosylase domain-containing protein [Thermoleophilia bacterium]|nr:lytic transglycosylase domain-containing protein [Thermoleophilia bacterium]